MTKLKSALPWVLSAWIAFVFVQSLFFKFTGAAEPIHIFQTIEDWLGLGFFEPGMRWVIGLSELVASILLFIPFLRPVGALMAIGVVSGAIFFHLVSPLGVEVKGDGGLLFFMACGVWISCAAILWLERARALALLARLGLAKPTNRQA